MFEFMKRMSPSDPQSAYKLAAITAIAGSVGSVAAVFIRMFIESKNNENLTPECSGTQLRRLVERCVNIRLSNRRKYLSSYRFVHLITLLFNMVLALPFFIMEEIFSSFETSGLMKDLLTGGVVLQVMGSAFHSGVRSASGYSSASFPPNVPTDNTWWYPANLFGSMMLNSGFTWITFLRLIISSGGVALACFFDSRLSLIGPKWQMLGWIASGCGLIAGVLDFFRILQWSYFQRTSDYFNGIFWLFYMLWIFVFGVYCRNLYKPEEENEASSGSEISDDDVGVAAAAPEAVTAMETAEDAGGDDGEKKKKRKKKKKHHKPEEGAEKDDEGSDDDV